MKRINLLELLVLVVFSDFSEAIPPMFNGCVSCSSPVEQPDPYNYDLAYFVQGQSMEPPRMYLGSKIRALVYTDATKFEYILRAANGDEVFANTGRNTDIVFLFGSHMKIYAKDNNDVSYSLNFTLRSPAFGVADYIISTDSAQYKKCKGRDSYRLERLYRRTSAGDLIALGANDFVYRGEDWCIFKMRRSDLTSFMIRRIAPREEYRTLECIFRATDYSLTPVPDTNNQLELRISLGGVIQNPKYVLETSTLDNIEEFFRTE